MTTASGTYALSSQRYAPGITHPDGVRRIESFSGDPWPTWIYVLEDGTRIEQEIVVPHGSPPVVISWRAIDPRGG